MRALLAHHEPGETRDAHVLARLGRDLRPQVLDRLALVAVRAHMLLLEQRDLLRPLLELALDDPLDDVVGLALLTGLCVEDLALGLACLRVDVVDGYDEWRRWRAGDVDRDLVRELPELVATGDEVRLALDLDQDADLPGRVEVGGHDALAGGASAALRRGRLALHAQDLDRLVEVALGLGQGGLAVHDPGTCALPERLDVAGLDVRIGTHAPAC